MKKFYIFLSVSILFLVSVGAQAQSNQDGCLGGEISISPKYVDFTSSNADRRVKGRRLSKYILKSPLLSGSDDIGDIDGDGFNDNIFHYHFSQLSFTISMYENRARFNLRSGIDGSKIANFAPPAICLWQNSSNNTPSPSFGMAMECDGQYIFGVTDEDGGGQRDVMIIHLVSPYNIGGGFGGDYILVTVYSSETGEIIREVSYDDKVFSITDMLRYKDVTGDGINDFLLLGVRYSTEFANENNLPIALNSFQIPDIIMDGVSLKLIEDADKYIEDEIITENNEIPGATRRFLKTFNDAPVYDHLLIRGGETARDTHDANVSFYDSRGNNESVTVRLPVENYGYAFQLISDLDGDGIGELLLNQVLSTSTPITQGAVYGTRSLYEAGDPQPLFTFQVPQSRGKHFINVAAIPDIDGDGMMDIYANNVKGQFIFSGADGENFYTTKKKFGQYLFNNEFNRYDRNQPYWFVKKELAFNQTTIYLGIDSRDRDSLNQVFNPPEDSVGTNLVKVDINCNGSSPVIPPPSDPIENTRFYINIIDQQLAQARRGIRRKPSVDGLSSSEAKKRLRKWRNRKKKILAARDEINDSLGNLLLNTSEQAVLSQFPGLSDTSLEALRDIVSQTQRRLKKRKRNRLFDEFVAAFAPVKAE